MNQHLALCPNCRNEVVFEESGSERICPKCGFRFSVSAPPRLRAAPLSEISIFGVILRFFVVVAVLVVVAIGVLFVGCALALKGL
jgi:rRNA maturation protein Nop10